MATNNDYSYKGTDFRAHPETYRIGRGEQGVLSAEPYKSELLPHWRFKTLAEAERSAKKLYGMFESYKSKQDFVGMDMARKFLQMGFTRSRRYANHPSGQKYKNGKVAPQAIDALDSEKAKSANIFYEYYQQAKCDSTYLALKEEHIGKQKRQR